MWEGARSTNALPISLALRTIVNAYKSIFLKSTAIEIERVWSAGQTIMEIELQRKYNSKQKELELMVYKWRMTTRVIIDDQEHL